MDDEQRRHLEDLLSTYQRRLRPLEKRAALQGHNTPPEILLEIEDIRSEIRRVKAELGSDDSESLSSKAIDANLGRRATNSTLPSQPPTQGIARRTKAPDL